MRPVLLISLSLMLWLPLQAQWENMTGAYISDVSCFTVSGAELLAGTEWGLHRSQDNGRYWTSFNPQLKYESIRCLATSGSRLFIGTWGAILIYTKDGTQWIEETPVLGTGYVNNFAFSDTNLFVGAVSKVFDHSPKFLILF